MEKNVLNTDLTGKVAVVTGASGTLCSIFAKALARAGAKVALLGRNMDKLKELADEIEAEGGTAKGYTCNVMNKANCLQVAEDVLADFGPCDILVNGAGGNNARANTDKEYFEMADLESDTVTFFDLDESGVEMVFNLNFIGALQQGGHPGQRHCPGLFCQRAERKAALQRGRHPHRPHQKDPCRHPHGTLRRQRERPCGRTAVFAEQ